MEQPYLDINNAAGNRQLVLRDEPITIGRHSDNRLVLADHLASRFHCVIERRGSQFVLRDLGASNGTRVNGKLVRTAALAPGDVVTVGNTQLVLVLPGARGPAKPATPKPALAKPTNPKTVAKSPAVTDDAIEELTEDDLVEEPTAVDPDRISLELDDEEEIIDLENPISDGDESPVPGLPAVQVQAGLADFESALWSMAEAQTDRHFSETDIGLLDCRGAVQHPPGKPIGPGERQPPEVLRLLLLLCFRSRATDIHIEPREGSFRCRIRVDGIMVDVCDFPQAMGQRISGVVKILCQIDTSQRYIVQEGHFGAVAPGRGAQPRRVDYRVSFAPAVAGQKLVIRVLDPTTAPSRIADLSLPGDLATALGDAIEQESGMVLVCGPTGSGKTSTLYALLRSIDVQQRNVVTIEDPVEIRIENATQIPVDEANGNTFPTLLRSVLRQDPDVILVGEIRDAETARVAMQASITGHLVFSTVHTKDTLGTVYRLLDLGVEPYLLAQGLQVVVAQRLVRRLCPACKRPVPLTEELRQRLGDQADGVTHLQTPVGCPQCLGTGYRGRIGFFEMLRATDELRDAISRSATPADLRKSLEHAPFTRLAEAGRSLATQGLVVLDEVEKAVGR